MLWSFSLESFHVHLLELYICQTLNYSSFMDTKTPDRMRLSSGELRRPHTRGEGRNRIAPEGDSGNHARQRRRFDHTATNNSTNTLSSVFIVSKARDLRAPITRDSFCHVMQTLSDLEKRATSHAGICRLRLGEPASVHKQLRQTLSRHPGDGETYLRRQGRRQRRQKKGPR